MGFKEGPIKTTELPPATILTPPKISATWCANLAAVKIREAKGGRVVVKIPVKTQKQEEAIDITDEVQKVIRGSGVREGFVIIYVPHDAAAVSIHRTLAEEEGSRLEEMLDAVNPDRVAPEYTKAALVAPTEVGVVVDGRMVLGEDQRIYFYEFAGPKDRVVYVYVGG